MKKQSATIISIILLIIFVIFALLNTANVEVNILITKFKMPLVLLILVCLLIGALIIYLFSLTNSRKLNRELKALQKAQPKGKEVSVLKSQIASLQKENDSLKKQLQKQADSTNNTLQQKSWYPPTLIPAGGLSVLRLIKLLTL